MQSNQLDELKNIIDIFVQPPVFTKEEKDDLGNTASSLLSDYVDLNTLSCSDPEFNENMCDAVNHILIEQVGHLFNYNIEENIIQIVGKACKTLYAKKIPRRSCKNTFLRHQPNIELMKEKINIIRQKPQPEQRTNEWYKFRYNLLTASSAWKAFGSQASQNQLIYDKCSPLNIEKYNSTYTDSPLHWGHKYEPLSIMLYEKSYGTAVEDFGCVPHGVYPFIGASPDGINTCQDSPLFGRMLEIKNIVNREITGIPKLEYWIQMQLQMETCDLNECDFLETRFVEYESKEDFDADGSFETSTKNEPKGIIIYFMKEGKPHYEYAPLGLNKDEYQLWENSTMEKNASNTWLKHIHWHLDEVSCVLVLRNKLWFQKAIYVLDKIWKIIAKERISGYDHRAPKRKEKQTLVVKKISSKCYINVNTLLGDSTKTSIVFKTPSPKNNQIININTESIFTAQEQKEDES